MKHEYPLITVGALVFDEKNKILFLKSHKWKGQFGIPSGKVDYEESVINGLKREIKEETGLDVFDIDFLMYQEIIEPKDFFKKSHFISLNHTCRAKNTEVILNEESQNYKWLTAENSLKFDLNDPTKKLIRYYLKNKNADNIIIKDLEINCIIGIRKRERLVEQKIYVTVEINTDTRKSANTKDINDAVNYSSIIKKIRRLAINKKYLLLESLAKDLANFILNIEKVNKVRVMIKKPKGIIKGKYVAVEITR